MRSDAEDKFVAWLITQPNARGSLYLERVARAYANYLRVAPQKLNLPLSVTERNVYACKTVNELEQLRAKFLAAPNYKMVNEIGHQTFSAGLVAYRRYLENFVGRGEDIKLYKEKRELMVQTETVYVEIPNANIRRVDFNHTELCVDCNPVVCYVNGEQIPAGTWRDLLVTLIEKYLSENRKKIMELYDRPLLSGSSRPFLLADKPNGAARQLSNGYWVFINYSIPVVVDLIGKLVVYCGVNLADIDITYTPKGNGGFNRSVSNSNDGSAVFAQQYVRSAFREWLANRYPSCTASTISTLCSDALYLYNNDRGITLSEIMSADNGLEKAYKALEQFFIANPRQTGTAATAARGYTDTLRLFKEFIKEKMPELLNDGAKTNTAIPQELLTILSKNYANGFRFETTAVRLLSDRAGIEIDAALQSALQRSMFCRSDDVYFMLDNIADVKTRQDIIASANRWLDDYGCFEISELYAIFADKLNDDCIDGKDDFEALYEFINIRDVRCVAYYGTRIARIQKSIPDLSIDIAKTIITTTRDELGGLIDEDELKRRFSPFSAELLSKIIKQYADELVKTEINGIICYQTLDTLGLVEDFSETLFSVLSRIDELDFTPSQENLNIALSLELGFNFRNEYNIPDDQTFRRLINVYYKAEPQREWKGSVFTEVTK